MSTRSRFGGVAALLVVVTSSACSAAERAAAPEPTRLQRADAAFAKLVDQEGVVLADVRRPPAPAPYDAVDVDHLVRDATDVLDRSVDPSLSRLEPLPAVRQVLAKQYDTTSAKAVARVAPSISSLAWIYASRVPRGAGLKSWTLAARSEAHLDAPEDDPKDAYLVVSVEAFFLHHVRIDGEARPIVVRRLISFASYDPNGGPKAWPAVVGSVSGYGNDFCSVATASVLRPARDAAVIVDDTRDLRRALRRSTIDDSLDGDNREYEERARRCAG